MDGKIVVGVGNIYANEALFDARISPKKPANKVTKKQYIALTESIKAILARAIEVGGTTLRDFSGSDGKPGYFQQTLNVYGREGRSCRVCGGLIKRIVIGQRSTFYCAKCQK